MDLLAQAPTAEEAALYTQLLTDLGPAGGVVGIILLMGHVWRKEFNRRLDKCDADHEDCKASLKAQGKKLDQLVNYLLRDREDAVQRLRDGD